LGKLYNDLFGLGIIINVNDLKCDGQYPRFMQALAILMIETKQLSTLITCFKIFYEILLRPKAEELLHLLESFYSDTGFERILSNILMLMWQL